MPKNEITITVSSWDADKNKLAIIRQRVFIEEQQVPQEMEWDEHDATATHFLVTVNNKSIACARLKTDGQIGRMAVLPAYRDQGIGSKLIRFIIQHAAKLAFKKLTLHAQTPAIPFYEKYGFSICSELFFEANIPHRKMQLKIPQEHK